MLKSNLNVVANSKDLLRLGISNSILDLNLEYRGHFCVHSEERSYQDTYYVSKKISKMIKEQVMKQNEFETIQEKLKEYDNHSMNYIEFEDVKEYDCIQNDKNLILVCGRDEESGMREVHWAANEVEHLVKGLKEIKERMFPETTKLSFIPEAWVKSLSKEGYEVFAIWRDYFIHNLNSLLQEFYMEDVSGYECLSEQECQRASEVTYACKGQSRGFTGQTEQWMREWIAGTESSASNSGAKDATVLIHRDEKGSIDGIVCTSIYAHECLKGAIVWIREIAVEPKSQGKGIGRTLLMQALQYGKQHGAERAFLAADENNYGAIHLYKSVGFIPSNEKGEINLISK